MPWWRQSITLVVVPHDNSQSRSWTLNWIHLLVLLAVGCGALATAGYFSFVGMQASASDVQQKMARLQDRIDTLKQKQQSQQQLRSTVASLRKQLRRSRKKHEAILRIAGFKNVTLKGQSPAPQQDDDSSLVQVSRELHQAIARNKQLSKLKQFVRSRNKVFRNTPMLWPTEGWMSSPFGYRKDPMGGSGSDYHEGLDIAAWHGTPVRAPADGRVVLAGWKSGYGRTVKLRHKYGYTTLFGHMQNILVKKGQRVTKGEAIGRVGNTGHSTGSHVHYEIRINGRPVNPWPYLVEHYGAFQKIAKRP